MSFTNRRAGLLIYVINALVERDPTFTPTEAVRAGESGLVAAVIDKALERGIDTSLLETWFEQDRQSRSDVDELFARWTNASETGDFLLSDGVNGWLWLSSIAVDAFLVSPYGDQDAPMN